MALKNNEENSVLETDLRNFSWCNTEVKFSKHSLIWTISNFSRCDETIGEFLESSNFSDSEYDDIKWRLKLYTKGLREEYKDYISLFLQLVSCDKKEVRAELKFSILDSRRLQTNVMESKAARSFNPKSSEWGFKEFLEQSILNDRNAELLPDDKLTIYCEVSLKIDIVNISGRNNSKEHKIPESYCLENLKNIFENREFNDIILIVKGKEFDAHKVILAAHSPVFSAMFKTEMKEIKENRVEISDVDPDVFEEMLYFIYTGKARNLENMASDLLAVADKYALEKLKTICEQALFSNISIETTSDVLILADMYCAEQLKKDAIDFINTCAIDIVKTKGWKNINEYPYLIREIYYAFIKQQTPFLCSSCERFEN